MPFFGVSQKRKKGERRKRTPFFAVSSIGLVGWCVGCAALDFASAASAIDAAGAGAGAVEAVRNAVVLPTSGTEAWWRAAVRGAVYALCERSSTCGRPSTGQFC